MKTKRESATIHDVAKASGVSIATASRVLSGSDYPVSAEARQRVQESARALAYTARGDASGSDASHRDIGVIIPTMTNPFYNELIMGIDSECTRKRFSSILCSSGRDPEREIQNVQLLLRKNVRGLIISSLNENTTFPAKLIQRARNIVFFDQAATLESVSYIRFDHFEAGRLATEYLLLHGHRRICFASPPITREVRRDLFNGYLRALESFNVSFCPDYVLMPCKEQDNSDHMYDFTNGAEMAKRLARLESKPTAVFTINDSTAYGMMYCLREMGMHVPQDVSIIGCDDLNTSAVTCPPLTTIHQPGYETGRLACQILLKEIAGDASGPSRIVLRPSVVERASVKMI